MRRSISTLSEKKKATDRQIRVDLPAKLCSMFCPYYKPGKKEDLACRGFSVIEALIKRGLQIPFLVTEKRPDPTIRKSLLRNLCAVCPFYMDGCDFVQHKEKSSPCGGFKVLACLLGADIITIDNIRDVR